MELKDSGQIVLTRNEVYELAGVAPDGSPIHTSLTEVLANHHRSAAADPMLHTTELTGDAPFAAFRINELGFEIGALFLLLSSDYLNNAKDSEFVRKGVESSGNVTPEGMEDFAYGLRSDAARFRRYSELIMRTLPHAH